MDEVEPGRFEDRDILGYNPHSAIRGKYVHCMCMHIGATVGYNYARGEFIGDQ